MKMTDSILKHIRKSVGLTEDNTEFDTELTNHINMSIVKLNQNGLKNNIMVLDNTTTWGELIGPKPNYKTLRRNKSIRLKKTKS